MDLFVRESNAQAIAVYIKLGYIIYRRVLKYYRDSDGHFEDALEMRKSMLRDVDKKSMIPAKRPVHPSELEFN